MDHEYLARLSSEPQSYAVDRADPLEDAIVIRMSDQGKDLKDPHFYDPRVRVPLECSSCARRRARDDLGSCRKVTLARNTL